MLSKLEKRLTESWIKLEEDLTAFHGTGNSVPHKRFDINKIGAKGGEGGQAKGWGLYFAGVKAVAQYYRQKLNGTLFPVRPNGFNLDGTTYMKDNGKFLKGNGEEISKEEYAQAFRKAQAEEEANSKNGKLYHVDIPEHEEYLNLDNPMTNEFQSKSVLNAFQQARKQFQDNITGSRGFSFYLSLANQLGSQKAASLWLNDHGVPGSCFKDQVSSEKGGSSYNYVIFDDSKINIKGIEESTAPYERGQSNYNGELSKSDGEAGYGVYAYPSNNNAMRKYYTSNGKDRVLIYPKSDAVIIDLTDSWTKKAVIEHARRISPNGKTTANLNNIQKHPWAIKSYLQTMHADAFIVDHSGDGVPRGKQLVIINDEKFEHKKFNREGYIWRANVK